MNNPPGFVDMMHRRWRVCRDLRGQFYIRPEGVMDFTLDVATSLDEDIANHIADCHNMWLLDVERLTGA